jgi:hypothetical protein
VLRSDEAESTDTVSVPMRRRAQLLYSTDTVSVPTYSPWSSTL